MAHEKAEEKETEKRDEKSQQDAVSALVGAAFLIWAGIVLLAGNLGFLSAFADLLSRLAVRPYELPFELPFFTPEVFQVFFVGAGVILLLEIAVRLALPAYRRRVLAPFVGAIVFFSLATGNWELVWPLVLIAVGTYVLLSAFARRR
jgi:hypothetical protein